MGKYNSSLTRVQPICDALRKPDASSSDWLRQLWTLAVMTKPGAIPPPSALGSILDTKIYERAVPPSTAFLRWALENPDRLNPLPGPEYGATGHVAQERRAALFGPDASTRDQVRAGALEALEKTGGSGSAQAWWAFEGFTHVDACFETSTCLVFIEGKRTETVSASTRWFSQRNQLWRNVEVAHEMARGREFGVILGVETARAGEAALNQASISRDSSYPHLSDAQRAELDRHLLGFVVWPQIVTSFGLSRSVLIDTHEPLA
jgi:hypothetical protein